MGFSLTFSLMPINYLQIDSNISQSQYNPMTSWVIFLIKGLDPPG
jgi:hypothetical protein